MFIQIHHRDPQNAHDIDGESSTSGELSAADSGRGTSEDGERQLHIDLGKWIAYTKGKPTPNK